MCFLLLHDDAAAFSNGNLRQFSSEPKAKMVLFEGKEIMKLLYLPS